MSRPRVNKKHLNNVAGYPGEILGDEADLRARKGHWRREFPGRSGLWLEIGCGRGAFLAGLAGLPEAADAGLLGLEIRPDRCVTARNKLLQAGAAGRFRILHAYAELLPTLFDCGELDRIYLNFPDPWPCSPDGNKRLFGPRFLPHYQHLLAPGGELWFKTDEPSAWRELLSRRPQAFELLESGDDLHHSPAARGNIETEFERVFRAKGQPICFARLRRVIHLPCSHDWP
jgi:tRNA (guanine-N7-)-methyltransferase